MSLMNVPIEGVSRGLHHVHVMQDAVSWPAPADNSLYTSAQQKQVMWAAAQRTAGSHQEPRQTGPRQCSLRELADAGPCDLIRGPQALEDLGELVRLLLAVEQRLAKQQLRKDAAH